uniref:Uncharacterized protein n=1 Tax=Arundo donax TaxID=35708 RepID=A0A0A8ZVJ2_ARUDO
MGNRNKQGIMVSLYLFNVHKIFLLLMNHQKVELYKCLTLIVTGIWNLLNQKGGSFLGYE